MKNKNLKRGFTLVEVLVSMAIFVSFTGILINSYSGLVRAQRDANEYRILYSEARQVFDEITSEVKDKAIYYKSVTGAYAYQSQPMDSLVLLSKDGSDSSYFSFSPDDGKIYFRSGNFGDLISLNSNEVTVSKFDLYVSPVGDPYETVHVSNDALQFQPQVTILVVFEKTMNNGEIFKVPLRTTISSRMYTESPGEYLQILPFTPNSQLRPLNVPNVQTRR